MGRRRSGFIALNVLATCGLVACGGGGGGGGGASTTLLDANHPSLSATYSTADGAPRISNPLNFTVSNPTQSTIYYTVTFVGTAVTYVDVSPYTAQVVDPLPTGPATGRIDGQSTPLAGEGGEMASLGNGLGGQIVYLGLVAPATLGAGTYSDTLTITACYDNACANPVPGSPLKIPVTYTVTGNATSDAVYSLSPPAPVETTTGASGPVTLSVIVSAIDPPPYGAYVSVGPSATGIVTGTSFSSNQNGTGTLLVTFKSPGSLTAGLYTDALVLTVCYDQACTKPAIGSPLTVALDYTVDPTPGKDFTLQTLPIAAAAIAWCPTDQRLYAIVPGYASNYAGSLVRIDPVAAAVLGSLSLGAGANPSLLSLSDDGQYAYVGQQQSPAQVQRVRLSDLTIDQAFQVPSLQNLNALRVAPGAPGTLALETYNGMTSVVIYDQGVARPQSFTTGSFETTLPITWGVDTSTLYAYDNVVPVGTLYQLAATNSGVSSTKSTANLDLNGTPVDLVFTQGLLYSSTGAIIDPTTQGVTAAFTMHTTGGGVTTSLALAIDPTLDRAYFLNSESMPSGSEGMTLEAFNLGSQKALWISRITTQDDTSSLIRWGTSGVAYLTSASGTTHLVLMSGSVISQ